VVLTQLVQAVVIAVLIGSVFLHIGTTQASVVRRQPVLFFCVINQGVFAALVSAQGSENPRNRPAECTSAGSTTNCVDGLQGPGTL
jgi:hypothetical protein